VPTKWAGEEPSVPHAPAWGIKWESNAYNCFPQEATSRTEPPTLNYQMALDSTRWMVERGFLNRVRKFESLRGHQCSQCIVAVNRVTSDIGSWRLAV